MRFQVIALALAACALASCQYEPYLYLINNSGRTIEIVRASNDGIDQTSELDRPLIGGVVLRNGQGRKVTWSRGYELLVEIKADGCVMSYRIPELIETPTNEYFVVQLERDRSLYFVASAVWPDTKGRVARRAVPDQPSGFPLPGQGACGDTRGH